MEVGKKPVDVESNRSWVKLNGYNIPVLTLFYELEAYRKLGRFEKAALLEEFLTQKKDRNFVKKKL